MHFLTELTLHWFGYYPCHTSHNALKIHKASKNYRNNKVQWFLITHYKRSRHGHVRFLRARTNLIAFFLIFRFWFALFCFVEEVLLISYESFLRPDWPEWFLWIRCYDNHSHARINARCIKFTSTCHKKKQNRKKKHVTSRNRLVSNTTFLYCVYNSKFSWL